MGNEIEGFIKVADSNRDKEQNALDEAEHFAMEMLGEFFKEKETQMDDFEIYLLEQEFKVAKETYIGNDLIETNEKEVHMNEDIFYIETGINLK